MLMENFRVTLEGKGWYLNRYQHNSLAFRLRTLKTDRTIFLITSLREGTSYLLFSHLDDDVYVTVNVVAEGETVPVPGKSAVSVSSENRGESSTRRRVLLPSAEKGMEVNATEKEDNIIGQGKRFSGKEPTGEGIGQTSSGVRKEEGNGQKPSEIKQQEKETTSSKRREKQVEKQPLLKSNVYYIDKNEQAIEVPTRDEEDLYRDAVAAINSGEYPASTEKLMKYLSSCSRCRYRTAARIALAEAYREHKEYDKALQNLDALTGSPKVLQKDMYLKKAEIYSITGDLRNAALSYQKAYETDENDIGILEKLGNIYYQNGDYEDALYNYEEGITHGLLNDEIFFRVASMYDRPGPLRNIERAYRYYRKLVDTFESSSYRVHSLERVRFFEKNFYNYR